MSDALKTTLERNRKAIELRPAVATGTATTVATLRDGLYCNVIDGAWQLASDLDTSNGGSGTAPDPGVLVRAGLAACLVQSYVMWAARLDIPLDAVEVRVEADYDARGMYGVDGAAPGWRGVRYVTTLRSGAPRELLDELVRTADKHSPVLDDLARALDIRREVRVVEG